MSSVPHLNSVRSGASPTIVRVGIGVLALVGAAGLGAEIGQMPMLALMACAIAFVFLAVPLVETLGVLTVWFLPYLILNLPTGAVTLKVPEVTAYLFMGAALVRALLRRETIKMPPVTPQALLYLAVVLISALLAPAVPWTHRGDYGLTTGADFRSVFIWIWLAISWLVVVAFYHVLGQNPALYRRCIQTHVLSGAVSSLVGLVLYVMTLRGLMLGGIGHSHAFVTDQGSYYRLSGVSYEPLMFAFYLLTVIPTTVVMLVKRLDWLPRGLVWVCLCLQLVAIILTFSSGGWVALIFAVGLLLWLLRPPYFSMRLLRNLTAAVVAVCLIFAVAYTVSGVVNRVVQSTVGKITQGGYKERNDELVMGMGVFHDHPIIGIGPGMIPFYAAIYHPVYRVTDTTKNLLISNLYVSTLAEMGLVGFAALFVCGFAGTAALAATLRRWGPQRLPVLTALTASLAGCAIQFWESQNLFLIYFPVLVGLAYAGTRLAPTRVEENMMPGQERR